MEAILLAALGGQPHRLKVARPSFSLSSLDEHVLHLQAHSIEISTIKAYATGARDYINFCLRYSLPLTPTPETLARYISYTSLSIASGPKYLSGARHFLVNLYPEFDSNRAHPLVQSAIRGSKKLRADPIRHKQPLRLHHLQAFVHILDISKSYDDLLFVTILSCAFYGCHRMGELVWNNDKSLWDWRKVIKRSSFLSLNDHVQYHLPYHKADPFYRGTDILLNSHEIIDPVRLLHSYVNIQDRIHGVRASLFI